MKALTPLRLLALPAVILAVTPGCKKNSEARNDPEWWRLEGERVALAHSVDLLKLRMANAAAARSELAAAAAEVKENAACLDELKSYAGELRGEMAYLVAQMEEERVNSVRVVRADLSGKEIGTFVGKNGRTYENVVVTRVTDIGVEFRHAHGSARLSAADLTPQQVREFALDPQVAVAALAKEKENAAAYEEWLGAQILVANEAKAASEQAAEERATERALASARARSEAVTNRINALAASERTSRLREEPRSFGGTYWGGYYRSSRYRYGTSYYYPNNCNTRFRPAYGFGSCSTNYPVAGPKPVRPPVNCNRPQVGGVTTP